MDAGRHVEIGELRQGDAAGAAQTRQLLNVALGDRMYSIRGILSDAADPTAGVWLARRPDGAAGAGPAVAAAIARLLVPEDAAYYQRFGPAAVSLFGRTVGSFEALAVDLAWRRRGIGAGLTRASLDWLRRQGCAVAVAI